MKPDFLCRHCFLPYATFAGRSLFDHAHDVALLSDDEILAIDFDLGSGPLPKQYSVADFDIERTELAVIVSCARSGGNDFSFHSLFLGGIRDDNTACGLFHLLNATDQHAILQRSKFHWIPPYVSSISTARLAPCVRDRQEDRARCPRLQALTHPDPDAFGAAHRRERPAFSR